MTFLQPGAGRGEELQSSAFHLNFAFASRADKESEETRGGGKAERRLFRVQDGIQQIKESCY